MNVLQKIAPEWPLRLGLGIMYLWSGIDITLYPTAWYWALRSLPQNLQGFVTASVSIDTFFRLQGVSEILLAFLLLAWFLPRIFPLFAALVATLEFAAILAFLPINAITFRDIGLLGGALTLFLIILKDHRGPNSTKS